MILFQCLATKSDMYFKANKIQIFSVTVMFYQKVEQIPDIKISSMK